MNHVSLEITIHNNFFRSESAIMSVHLIYLLHVDSPEFNLEAMINFTTVSEEYETDGVTATLEWTQEYSLYSYQVSMVPPSWNIISSRSERVRLQVKAFYDILYNVSVGTSLCGLPGATVSTTLYYGKINTNLDVSIYLKSYILTSNCKVSSNCENPDAQLDHSVEVIGYQSETVAKRGIKYYKFCLSPWTCTDWF